MKLFKLNEHAEVYQVRKLNDLNFLSEMEGNNYIYNGDKVVCFETNDKVIKYSSKLGYNDIKYPFSYGEKNI